MVNSLVNATVPTPLQQACVARSLLSPAGGHYIQQLVCDWPEPLQIDAWRRAWNMVVARHDALRAFFQWDETMEIAESFADAIAVPIEVRDEVLPDTDQQRTLSDFLRDDRRRGFNLAAPPLWRLTVFNRAHRVKTVWTFHHSLLDGRSHIQVWREVDAIYRALLREAAPALPAARSFREFTTWLTTKPEANADAYWRERLRGFQAPTELPTLSVSPDSGDDERPPAMETLVLDGDLTGRLRVAAQRHGVTLNNLVQGAWALALARYQAIDEVVFGVVRSCRHWTAEDPNARVGMFINTIPFRVSVAPGQPVGAWLQGLREQQFSARAGEFASAEQIRRWCGFPRSTVLYRTALMFEHHDPSELPAGAGQSVRLVEKTDLPTFVAYAGKVLTLTFDYSPRRHSAAQAEIILSHVQRLLESLATAPAELPLCDLQMLTPDDHRLTFEEWQGPVTEQPATPLHRVLEAQAARTPAAPAVEFLGRTIGYQELHRRANQLARRLLQFCKAGDRVVVVLEHSLDQPVVWLAALKAGVVYAPVDPANPQERLEFYFADLKPTVLVTQETLRPLLPVGTLQVLCVDAPAERAALAALEGDPLAVEPLAEAPADLLYTSGSTGRPKAAINSRAGLDNFAAELRRTFDFGPGDRVLQSSSTSFDASLFDFVAALQSGATLVLVPAEQLRPGPGLARMLTEQRISVSLLTPTVMRSTPVPESPVLRVLFSAGEPLTADLLERWSPGRRVFNVCGPTECSIWFHCDESIPDGNRPTIGRLIQNCRGYVLDESRQPVPVGVPGELYLGGAGVGWGYWQRDELTAEKYLSDPFAAKPGAWMYRTGDRVRWLADGRMEFLGRFDFQVKVQGVRVELGEIEAALRRHPNVADAALVLHEDRLLAWFVPRGLAPADAALRGWLADHIPLIFTPSEFHSLPEFPRTLTGKADRATLLKRWLVAQETGKDAIAPKLSAEARRQVVEEWNNTARPYPLHRSVVEFFQEQAARQPQAPALKFGKMVLSYAALNMRANQLAHQLLGAGLQPEDIVVLRFERSTGFVVSALAVLKAGGSYLPLDAQVPAARQRFVLEDSRASFALMAREFLATLAGWSGWSASVSDDDGENNPKASDPDVAVDQQRRAYVIYTSGSTGKPKGVEIEHRSLTNLVCFYHERLQMTPADRTTLLANPAFDASGADFWPALCAGGTVLVPEKQLLGEPDQLVAWLAAEGATFSFVPTAIGELLFSRPWPKKLALRYLCVGGETLRLRPPAGLSFAVLNSYGPTENTVDATWDIVLPDGLRSSGAPAIGRPIGNVRAYVLDDAFQPVAAGVAGELFLGGVQVARGYLNRPELTRERFLPDPFSGAPDARMYRTGDLVRWRDDGCLEFLGRNDDQIQIRGQRVELGEIEAELRQHPGVREVCCRPIPDKAAPQQNRAASATGVIAHVVMSEGHGELAPELRRFLAARLPAYMVPAIFVAHQALPLTPQGKVDRVALDAAAYEQPALKKNESDEPSDDSLVHVLTELWQRILPDGRGGPPDQTFQELGGDSLGAVKLLLGVERITSRRLALSTFLLEPTLAGLCRAVKAAEDASGKPVLALRHGGTKPPVFCLYNVGGDVEAYFNLVAEVGEDQPVYGIRSTALNHLERVPDSIEAAAREVRELLREFRPKGPFALVGFSWAGLLAFEVARQCAHEGGSSPFCALLGTSAPVRRRTFCGRLGHALHWLPGWAWRLFREPGLRWQRFREVFSARFVRKLVAGERLIMPEWATRVPLAVELIKLAQGYQPRAVRPIPIHLFRERGSFHIESQQIHFALTNHLADGGWEYWAGCKPEIHWLEGEHLTVIQKPHVKQTAEELRAALEKHFAAPEQRVGN